MTRFVLPTPDSVKDILSVMYGDELEVTVLEAGSAADGRAATYVGDDDQIVAVCACDPEFVIFSGAALTMVPPDAAREMVDEKDFSEVVIANFHEVMNICSRLLMSNDSPHLRLDKTIPTAEAEATINGAGADMTAVGFSVNIPSYGSGQLLFQVS